jgi:hypothetical protein
MAAPYADNKLCDCIYNTCPVKYPGSGDKGETELNEQQIIQQLSALYANCRSYEDQGYVDTIIDPGTTQERRGRVAFRTAFVRPMYFRLEWMRFDPFTGKPNQEGSEAIWCDGAKAYSRNRFDEHEVEFENLDHAIASATGVAAHTVSSLLMPDVLSFKFMRHGNLSSVPDEILFDEPCCHLCATTDEQRVDILVSKQSFVLRRIREERVLKGGAQMTLPQLPPGISAEEREEMLAVLSEATEDLHEVSDCSYTNVRFDNQLPQALFQQAQVAW